MLHTYKDRKRAGVDPINISFRRFVSAMPCIIFQVVRLNREFMPYLSNLSIPPVNRLILMKLSSMSKEAFPRIYVTVFLEN